MSSRLETGFSEEIEAGLRKSSFNNNNKKSQAYLVASDGDNHDKFCHVGRNRHAIDSDANILKL